MPASSKMLFILVLRKSYKSSFHLVWTWKFFSEREITPTCVTYSLVAFKIKGERQTAPNMRVHLRRNTSVASHGGGHASPEVLGAHSNEQKVWRRLISSAAFCQLRAPPTLCVCFAFCAQQKIKRTQVFGLLEKRHKGKNSLVSEFGRIAPRSSLKKDSQVSAFKGARKKRTRKKKS